jgi:hypothetical protein
MSILVLAVSPSVYRNNWKWYTKRYVAAPNFVNRKRFNEELCLKLEGRQIILDTASIYALSDAIVKRGHSADVHMLITQASHYVYQNNRLDQIAGAGSSQQVG